METIETNADTITKWIDSCMNEEHLHICRDMIYVLISERFIDHKSMPEVKELLLQKVRKKRESLLGQGIIIDN
jgi:hypothetical protein